jgi:hypothetical protein
MGNLPAWVVTIAAVAVGLIPALALSLARPVARSLDGRERRPTPCWYQVAGLRPRLLVLIGKDFGQLFRGVGDVPQPTPILPPVPRLCCAT